MTDRELLELAAKAAGIEVVSWNDYSIRPNDPRMRFSVRNYPWGQSWNPLTDDGDALRLVVRLAMTIRQEPSAAAAGWGADTLSGAPTRDGRGPWFWKEWINDQQNPYAATRRVIVRAAAAIGEQQ